MHKILLFILFSFFSFSQVLDCKVSVNADLVDQTNSQIFETLEMELNEFINKTSWVNIRSEDYNRINCTMLITIENYANNEFQANLQIQSSRPVFGSTYATPLLNRKDDNFNFSYQEFESLNFNPNNTNTSLVSLISYYVFVILGIDADSFALFGGDPYYVQARKIVDLSQTNRFSGWKQSENKTNRYWLIDQLSTNPFSLFRQAFYDYHINGLDLMVNQPELGKQTISKSIADLKSLSESRPNSLVVQLFFDTKSDEVVQIFSGGPSFDTSHLKKDLNRVAPFFSAKWVKIR
tara:strand:+ start:2398 stop:3276 length:879 start_codon:yes stop_codon:yes gene_type:complete